MCLSGQPLRLRFVFRSDVPRSRCSRAYCETTVDTRPFRFHQFVDVLATHTDCLGRIIMYAHAYTRHAHAHVPSHDKKWGEVGRQASHAHSPGRDERDASGRGQASLCATADAHDTGGYTRDAPRTPDVTDTPQRAVRPHTRRLSHTAHARPERGATVERTGLGGRKAGAPARDRVELDVLVQAARVVARRAQEAPVHLRWEALRGQNAAAPGPYRRPAEHRSASSGELSQARMGHAARNGTATYAGPPCTTRGGVACTYLVASARTRSRKARTGTPTGRTRIGGSGARRRVPGTGDRVPSVSAGNRRCGALAGGQGAKVRALLGGRLGWHLDARLPPFDLEKHRARRESSHGPRSPSRCGARL